MVFRNLLPDPHNFIKNTEILEKCLVVVTLNYSFNRNTMKNCL